MNIFTKRSVQALIASSAVIASFAFAGSAFAATPATSGHGSFQRPAVVGTVAAISGDTLTVNAMNWQRGANATPTTATPTPTTTTYSVDATNATVTKSGAASSVSAIAVGDMLMVQGTVSGTSVTATSIRDGVMMGGRAGGAFGARPQMQHASTTPIIQGNGEPVIGGTISAISGTTLTVSTKSGTTYTVDASSATVAKPGVTGATLTNVAVGDNVVVQGAVNGSSVTASSIIDQPAPSAGAKPASRGGVLGGIGSFFSHLFGFF